LSPLIAGPVNKTGIKYKGFVSCERKIDVTLLADLAGVWNFGWSKLWIIRVSRVGGVEQCGPNRGALSAWKNMNPVARFISERSQVGDEITVSFWNVVDRVNFDTPISSEGRFPASIDEGQLYMHWFCDVEGSMIRSVYTHPSPVRLSSGVISANYTPIDEPQTDKSDNGPASSYPIKPIGYPDLPFPESSFVGAVLLFFGLSVSSRWLAHGPFYLMMGGWLVGVFGGVLLVVASIPRVTGSVVSIARAFHP
jgi:hypothetical protein